MLMRTDPFRDLDRLTQQVLGTSARPASMPMDAYRLGDDLVIEVDLPGVDPASIELTVEKNVLTIKADRRRPELDGVEYLIGERMQGSFSRQLFLGDNLDADRIQADHVDGVLHLRVPVAEKAKPRRIEIGGRASQPTAIEAHSDELVGTGS